MGPLGIRENLVSTIFLSMVWPHILYSNALYIRALKRRARECTGSIFYTWRFFLGLDSSTAYALGTFSLRVGVGRVTESLVNMSHYS